MRFYLKALDLAERLWEFDTWITSKLGEIKDTDKFQAELEKIIEIIEILGKATADFENLEDFDCKKISKIVVSEINSRSKVGAKKILDSFAALLYLVTGRTDNNVKCQLPLHLKSKEVHKLPKANNGQVLFVDIPRVMKAEQYLDYVNNLRGYEEQQDKILLDFVKFILSDSNEIGQLWSIGHSYFHLKRIRKEKELITPIVIFKVRGSVSATGGHEPEEILRELMKDWGLRPGVDFNTIDVPISEFKTLSEVVREDSNPNEKEKERKFDFILPYKTEGWSPKIFIQCQFYAGDSGSVSHKNVDQTESSRRKTIEIFKDAKFIEYVDGAGYYSSLNGDLKKLLQKQDTYSFFQISTAPVKLRNCLQEIGFVTPLELEHAILRSNGDSKQVSRILGEEGYDEKEISRCIEISKVYNLIICEGNRLFIKPERRNTVRRYLLLDVVTSYGEEIEEAKGCVLVPGYGMKFGMELVKITSKMIELVPTINQDYSSHDVFPTDLQYLSEKGFIKF